MCRVPLDHWPLTPRERAVAERIGRGLEIKEIARELGIGYESVKSHIRNAKGKMHARNQLEVAILLHGGTPQYSAGEVRHDTLPDGERAIEHVPAWQTGRTTLPYARGGCDEP